MKFKLIIALIASTLLVGCASSPKMHKYDSKHSDAWNLAWPADIKIADAKVPKNGPVAPERGLAGAATAGTLTYLKPPPGFSPGFGAGLAALAWISEQERVSQRSRIVAWVPKSEADSPEAATKLFFDLTKDALRQVMQDYDYPSPYSVAGFGERSNPNTSYFVGSHYGLLSGGECSGRALGDNDRDVQCAIRVSFTANLSGPPGQNVVEDVAPERLGGYPAWRVTGTIQRSFMDTREGSATWYPRLPEVEIYTELSKKLPEWSYIYIAPKYSSIRNDSGDYQWLMFPVLLYRGEPLYFIRPEA